MIKRRLGWGLLAIVVLIAAVGAGVWAGQRSQSVAKPATTATSQSTKHKDAVNRSSQSTKKASSQSQATSSVKQDATNNLTTAGAGGGTLAMAITCYASQHVAQAGTHSWQEMYQSYLKDMGTIIMSKTAGKKMVKPGQGVVYYVVPRGGEVETSKLATYPSYTLEKDQRINIYQPDESKKVATTVSLKQVVQGVNQAHQATKVREGGYSMAIADRRDDVESDGDANHLTTKDLDAGDTLAKVVIAYGMMRDTNEYWQNLHNYFDENVTLEIVKSDQGGNMIAMPDNSTGCIVYYAPQNSTGGVPDLYNFGHNSADGQTNGDIPDLGTVGATTGKMIQYINAHGGRAALDQIKLKAGSDFQSF